MKLLVLTQKVDSDDGVLGFFHNWIEKMANNFEKIEVICLQLGAHALPSNVKIRTLGKETSKSRIKYVFRFYKYIWQDRQDYDAVLVHMNKEYVVLGGFFWWLMGKKIVLWYNHEQGGIISLSAYFWANKILYTSPYSFFAKFKKSEQMPAGIDTEKFLRLPEIEKNKNLVLYLGRIAPIKNVDILIDAVSLCDKAGKDFFLDIVGEAKDSDIVYFEKIKEQCANLLKKSKVRFFSGVPNTQTPKIYNQHQVYINLTNSGSLDKTILEAMACETIVLVSNQSLKGALSDVCLFKEGDSVDLSRKIITILDCSESKKIEIGKSMRQFVVDKHNLNLLMDRLLAIFKGYLA